MDKNTVITNDNLNNEDTRWTRLKSTRVYKNREELKTMLRTKTDQQLKLYLKTAQRVVIITLIDCTLNWLHNEEFNKQMTKPQKLNISKYKPFLIKIQKLHSIPQIRSLFVHYCTKKFMFSLLNPIIKYFNL